jgi:hypothetical protein
LKEGYSRLREGSMGLERLTVRSGIVDDRNEVQGVRVDALITLDEMQFFGSGVTELIEPSSTIGPNCVHHQGVSIFVPADRVTPPGGIGIGGMLAV